MSVESLVTCIKFMVYFNFIMTIVYVNLIKGVHKHQSNAFKIPPISEQLCKACIV